MGDTIIWIGAGMAVLGLCGVIWCLVKAAQLKAVARQGGDPTPMMRRLIAWNMGSVGIAFLGLGVMVVGMAI